MRSLFWLWVVALLLCLVTDSAVYWVARHKISIGLDLALDAALIGGIDENDLIRGRQLARADKAEAWADIILKRNLSGYLADNSVFSFEFYQENDRIWVKGRVDSELPFLLGATVGKKGRMISVSKRMSYQGGYK